MKTTANNIHFDEFNQTTRLSEEDIHDPSKVLTDFFEDYDLVSFRKKLWEWFKAVVSSPEFASEEGHERNGHTYFFEKVEALVEAAYCININKSIS